MVDAKDLRILEVLREDARASPATIGRKIGMSTRAVYDRIRKLEKERVIVQYITRINFDKIGVGVLAYIMVQSDHYYLKKHGIKQSALANEIARSFPNLSDVCTVTGDDDIIMKVRAKDIPTLNAMLEKILNIPGVLRSKSVLVLHDVKQALIRGDLSGVELLKSTVR